MKQWAKKIMTLARKKIKLNNEEQPIENMNKNHQSFQGKIHEENIFANTNIEFSVFWFWRFFH